MPNFTFGKDSITFKINGKDTRTGLITILLTIGSLVVSLLFIVILLQISFMENNPIVAGILVILLFIGLINGTIILVKRGSFARYSVTLSPESISCFDTRGGMELFHEPFAVDNLYIAGIRQQVGYVSRKFSALCYGPVKQELVEDKKPAPNFILLVVGNEKGVADLLASVSERIHRPDQENISS